MGLRKVKEIIMKRKVVWPWVVFAVLAVSLVAGCATNKPHGGIPAMDAYNNQTGEEEPDGKLDTAYTDYLRLAKDAVNTITGGTAAPATNAAELIITGVSTLVVTLGLALMKDKKDKKDVMGEIALTDKNVATVADAAKVPEKDLV